MEDSTSLDRFIKRYRQQLAQERNELLSCSMSSCNQSTYSLDRDDPHEGHLSNNLSTLKSADFTNPHSQPPTGHAKEDANRTNLSFPREERRDDAERVRNQADYRHCLDRQIAEKRQRKSSVNAKVHSDHFETGCGSQHCSVRPPSPPIKSHYRHSAPTPFPERSPNSQRLNDLTELRQMYSNKSSSLSYSIIP